MDEIIQRFERPIVPIDTLNLTLCTCYGFILTYCANMFGSSFRTLFEFFQNFRNFSSFRIFVFRNFAFGILIFLIKDARHLCVCIIAIRFVIHWKKKLVHCTKDFVVLSHFGTYYGKFVNTTKNSYNIRIFS